MSLNALVTVIVAGLPALTAALDDLGIIPLVRAAGNSPVHDIQLCELDVMDARASRSSSGWSPGGPSELWPSRA